MIFRPRVIYTNPDEPRENSVVRYVGNRVLYNNKNFLAALTGGTGSGKSWAALSFAEIYSQMFNIPFDPAIHIIHSVKQCYELIMSMDSDKKVPYGTLLIFEEIQIEANSRTWGSNINIALNRLVSTFRDRRLVVLFTTPIMKYIDKQTRELFHGEFSVEGFDKTTGISRIRPRFLTPKQDRDDFYRARLVVEYAVRGKVKHQTQLLNQWSIKRASQQIINIYEAKKKQFNIELVVKDYNSLNLSEKQEAGKNKSDDLIKVKELYDKYGEDYLTISPLMPHLAPTTIQTMILLIKKTIKFRKETK